MNYQALNPGDTDPNLGRKITVVIDKGVGHIVYLDEDLNIQEAYAKDLDQATGRVVNRITALEGLMGFTQENEKQMQRNAKRIIRIKNLLGEAFARSYKGDCASALQVLDDAEFEIRRWNQDVSSRWYFSSAVICATLFGAVLLIAQFYGSALTLAFGKNFLPIITVGLLGSLGAFASICMRHRGITLDANAGASVHTIEASARIFLGVVTALVMILMAKGGLLLELVEKSADSSMYIYVALGIMCGASERVLPSFVERAEKLLGGTQDVRHGPKKSKMEKH